MTYCEELKLLIFDKLFLGIILLILGFIFSRLLEKYKANISILKDFTVAKISKISETWNILVEFKEESQIVIEKVFTIRRFITSSLEEQTRAIMNDTAKLDENLKLKMDLVNKTLQHNQFWIGNEFYERFSEYRDSIIEYYQAVMHNKDVDFEEMKRKMNNNKVDLLNIVKESLKN